VIGEHTDYNGGFVLPAAIGKGTYVVLAPGEGKKIRVSSENIGRWEEWEAGQYPKRGSFGDYLRGVLLYSRAPAVGLDILLSSDLPIGGGLSSSASLEMAFALAVNEFFSLGRRMEELVEISHRAENEFVGVKCGIMDQFASALSREGHLLFLNTKNLSYNFVPFPGNLLLALVDTGIRRRLSSSQYNQRREECRRALQALRRLFPDLETLSDADEEMLLAARPYMDEVAYKRAVHVVSENQRVEALVEFLRSGDLCMVEKIMKLAHLSLSEDFEVSLPQIDRLVEKISSLPYVYGARLTGAGFGGYIIALLLRGKEKTFLSELSTRHVIFTLPRGSARIIYSRPG